MIRIFINPGHGGSDPGAVGNGLREKDLNLKIALEITKRLRNQYSNIIVKCFRENDKNYSLNEITAEANRWKADIFISIHINAGGGTGFESFAFNGAVQKETLSIQSIIHDEIMKSISKYKVRDRGKKRANFAVLRQTRMPAFLSETLFIDNKADSELLKNDEFISDAVQGHVNGIAKAMKLTRKPQPQPNPDVFFRVVTGSFQDKKNAEQRVKELMEKGFNSFIDIYRK